MIATRDTSSATTGSGVRDGFHTASHHSNARARMDSFALINRYHVPMLGYFLEKLYATPDGDGSLLDHSVVLYGGNAGPTQQPARSRSAADRRGWRIGTAQGRSPSPVPGARRCRT